MPKAIRDAVKGVLNEALTDPDAVDPQVAKEAASLQTQQMIEQQAAEQGRELHAIDTAQKLAHEELPLGMTDPDIARPEARNRSMLYFGDQWDPDSVNLAEQITDSLGTYTKGDMQRQTLEGLRERAENLTQKDMKVLEELGYAQEATALNAAQFQNVFHGMQQIGNDITEFIRDKAVQTPNGWRMTDMTSQDRVELVKMIKQYGAMDLAFRGATKQAGQVLRLTREMANLGLDQRRMAGFVDQMGGNKAIDDMADIWLRTEGLGLEGRVKTARQLTKGSRSGALYELWRGSLLMGIPTNLRNLLGNMSNIMIEDGTAWGAAFFRAVTGNPDELAVQADASFMIFRRGVFRSAMAAAKAGVVDDSVKGSYTGTIPRSMKRDPLGTKLDDFRQPQFTADVWGVSPQSSLGRGIDWFGRNYVRMPFRVLTSMDEMFKVFRYEKALRKEAKRGGQAFARENNLPMDDPGVKQKTEDLFANPTTDMEDKAMNAARRSTFQDLPETGERGFAQSVMNLRRAEPFRGFGSHAQPVRWIMPFAQTPLNIANRGMKWNPVIGTWDIARAIHSKDPQEAFEAATRVAVSSTAVFTLWEHMDNFEYDPNTGEITQFPTITNGYPPGVDKGALKRSKWQPYSILVGDNYYSYQLAEPAGMMLAVLAQSRTLYNSYMMSDHANAWEMGYDLATGTVMGIAEYMGDKAALSGVTSLVESIIYAKDSGDSMMDLASKEVAAIGSGFMPQFLRQIVQGTEQLDPEAFENQIRSRYKGTGPLDIIAKRWYLDDPKNIPVGYDTWGQPRTNTPVIAPFERALNPLYMSDISVENYDQDLDQWLIALRIEAPWVNKKQSFKGLMDEDGVWTPDENGITLQSKIDVDKIDPTGFLFSEMSKQIGLARAELMRSEINSPGFREAMAPEEFELALAEEGFTKQIAGGEKISPEQSKKIRIQYALRDGTKLGMHRLLYNENGSLTKWGKMVQEYVDGNRIKGVRRVLRITS